MEFALCFTSDPWTWGLACNVADVPVPLHCRKLSFPFLAGIVARSFLVRGGTCAYFCFLELGFCLALTCVGLVLPVSEFICVSPLVSRRQCFPESSTTSDPFSLSSSST